MIEHLQEEEIQRLKKENERLREALGHAIKIIEEHVPETALGMNSDGDIGGDDPSRIRSWPLLEEYLHNMRKALKQE